MALKFKEGKGLRDVMQEAFLLGENPFSTASIYDPANPGTYEPRMYGAQHSEFRKKFFILPVMNQRQVLGSIWSSQTSDDWRGYGKSMLMAEESKRICRDFGAEMLREMDVEQDSIDENPLLAGYCSFDQSKGVKSFPSALLDAVAFILEQPFEDGTVHQELRRRISARHARDGEDGYEGESIRSALMRELRRLRLNIQLSHKTLSTFIDRLATSNTEALTSFIRNDIGPRIKANEGFNFVHIFNAYASLAGIVHITYFVDQIENFAKFVRNQDRDVKILRESMCQTSPTSQIASFVFQMHVAALDAIEDWWMAEHLPDLDFQKPINQTRTINLTGLETTVDAITLAKKYLSDHRVNGATPPTALHPFPEEVIEAVRVDAKGNPRSFLRRLGDILDQAVSEERPLIDLVFVEPLLRDDYLDDTTEDDDDYDNPER